MKKIISVLLSVILTFSVMSLSAFSILGGLGGIMGDVDKNDKVDIADARKTLLVAAGIEEFDSETASRTDIDGDGIVSVSDARAIFRASLGLQSLDIGGSFRGFDGGEYFATPEELTEYFNAHLNAIKENKPGFTKSTDSKIIDISINAGGFSSVIENAKNEIIAGINSSADTTTVAKGSSGYDNSISVEGERFVSLVTPDDLMGAKAVLNTKKNTLTITVCIADCEKEALLSSPFTKILSSSEMESESTLTALGYFTKFVAADGVRSTFKNSLFTATFDLDTDTVIDYKTEYDVALYALGNDGILGLKINSINYEVRKSVTYSDFLW